MGQIKNTLDLILVIKIPHIFFLHHIPGYVRKNCYEFN